MFFSNHPDFFFQIFKIFQDFYDQRPVRKPYKKRIVSGSYPGSTSASRIRTRNTERMKFFYHHINRSDNLFNKFFFKIKKVCKFPKPKSTETSILAENLPKIEIDPSQKVKGGGYCRNDLTEVEVLQRYCRTST